MVQEEQQEVLGVLEDEGQEEQEVVTEQETPSEEQEAPELEEVEGYETANQTAERLKASGLIGNEEDAEGDDSKTAKEPEAPKVEADKVEEKPQEDEEDDFVEDPTLLPPERFTAKQKKQFLHLNKGMKRAVNKMKRDLESGATKAREQYKAEAEKAVNENRYIQDVVAPHVNKWAERGHTVPQVLNELVATHEALMNPETQRDAYFKLGRNLGIDTSPLQTESESTASAYQSSPEYISMQKQHEELLSWKNNLEQQQKTEHESRVQQAEQDILNQIDSVRQEQDPTTGNYLYPEFQQDGFLATVTPLAREIARNVPNVNTWTEAYKRAVHSVRGTSYDQSTPTNPHVANNSETQRRAQAASVSVRGRAAPSSNSGGLSDIPQEALSSAAATAKYLFSRS